MLTWNNDLEPRMKRILDIGSHVTSPQFQSLIWDWNESVYVFIRFQTRCHRSSPDFYFDCAFHFHSIPDQLIVEIKSDEFGYTQRRELDSGFAVTVWQNKSPLQQHDRDASDQIYHAELIVRRRLMQM